MTTTKPSSEQFLSISVFTQFLSAYDDDTSLIIHELCLQMRPVFCFVQSRRKPDASQGNAQQGRPHLPEMRQKVHQTRQFAGKIRL